MPPMGVTDWSQYSIGKFTIWMNDATTVGPFKYQLDAYNHFLNA